MKKRPLIFALVALVGIVLPTLSAEQSTGDAPINVPFVGCQSDGQTGPLPAPVGLSVSLRLDPRVATRVAMYRPENGPAVLGPRGWACLGSYGSAQAGVVVTPKPITSFANIVGVGIQVTNVSGDTSGRFRVAQIVARAFPVERAFVDRIVREGLLPAKEFPAGPFSGDRLTYRSDHIVEFETRARAQGLGTLFQFASNAEPIRGVTILTSQHDVRHLATRLPQNMTDLAPFIIREFQRELP